MTCVYTVLVALLCMACQVARPPVVAPVPSVPHACPKPAVVVKACVEHRPPSSPEYLDCVSDPGDYSGSCRAINVARRADYERVLEAWRDDVARTCDMATRPVWGSR